MKAPVVIFTYNRPLHLKETLRSLQSSTGIAETDVYVYCDGPRNEQDREKQQQIVQLVEEAKQSNWSKSFQFVLSENNKGLAPSIVSGVTTLVNQYGRVIVLEDDLVVSQGFILYMNEALQAYENAGNVYAVSGYMFPISTSLKKSVLLPYISSWGWATWKQKWKIFSLDTPPAALVKPSFALRGRFNLAHYNYHHMFMTERNKSWAINWYYQVFKRNGLSVYPSKSLVINNGFDGTGENCGSNIFLQQTERMTDKIEVVFEDSIDIDFYNAFLKHFGTPMQKLRSIIRYVPFKRQIKSLLRK
ncbi:glycosyltransferase family A protein [Aridibaculum aurantiacum]|uniref:glycosyltransferase family A protein n=1 Tax=Aridibaculum aurantiacum TaxID=2810307 RepID=UPI001A960909|nr:glycosyltransferase family A protein [Aridibaculum aurantiacum]